MFDVVARIHPLIWPTAIIVIGFIGNRFLVRIRAGRRAVWVGFAFLLFSFSFVRTLGSPFHPDLSPYKGPEIDWANALAAIWWLSTAWFVVSFMRLLVTFEDRPRESKLVTDLLAGLVYIAALLAITSNVLGVPVAGLVATSGVVAIVLGLALQSSLSDVFSGLSLNLERPYVVGDYIMLEGNIEGQVVELNWRATRIRTPSNDVAAIPNSVLAKSRIVNCSRPQATHAVTSKVTLDNRTAPDRGIEIIRRATLACPDLLQLPAPGVECVALRGDGIDYEVTFSVLNIGLVAQARTQLLTQIHRHATWAGIGLPGVPSALGPPVSESSLLQPVAAPSPKTLVEHSGLFVTLPPAEIEAIAAKLKRRDIAEGQSVVVSGQEGGSLFFVMAGVLDVRRRNEAGDEEPVGRLGPGDYFGETALLDGKPNTATVSALTKTVVYELAKEDVSVLARQPSVIKQLTMTVARRTAALRSREAANHEDHETGPSVSTLERLRAFLHGSSTEG